jgi:hypothetical protein
VAASGWEACAAVHNFGVCVETARLPGNGGYNWLENLYFFNFTFYLVAPAGNVSASSFFWTDSISADRSDYLEDRPPLPQLLVVSNEEAQAIFQGSPLRCAVGAGYRLEVPAQDYTQPSNGTATL